MRTVGSNFGGAGAGAGAGTGGAPISSARPTGGAAASLMSSRPNASALASHSSAVTQARAACAFWKVEDAAMITTAIVAKLSSCMLYNISNDQYVNE